MECFSGSGQVAQDMLDGGMGKGSRGMDMDKIEM